jgi:hypothetical protein
VAAPTEAEIAQVAAQYSIPPAILMGVMQTQGVATMGLTSATLGAYAMTEADAQADPLLAIQLAARTLQQSFAQTGSWEAALSQYLTGNPDAWQSPTSGTGGQVLSILGSASTNPTLGMSSYTPADPAAFNNGATAFGNHLESLVQLGGIVSPQVMRGYRQSVQGVQAYTGKNQFATTAEMHQIAEDILTAAKIPITDANVAVISTMARGEGMPLGDFNWLATTSDSEPSVGTVNNTPGVKQYASYQDGIEATAQTLINGNYNAMIQLMRSGADLKTIASNPEVQNNLRTWQGGSNEDVRNLANTANQPGGQGQQKDPAPPSKVGEFAAQLQGANIDPREFAAHFATLAAQRRRMLGSQRTDVSDYINMQQYAAQQGKPVSPMAISEFVRSQPHPTYPGVTVGAFNDTFDRASLYSAQLAKRFPTTAETSRMVGLDDKQMVAYFQNEAAQKQPQTQPNTPARSGNIVPLTQPGQPQPREQEREQETA